MVNQFRRFQDGEECFSVMPQCTIAFCLESCQIKVEETCLQTYIIHLQIVYHSLIANMHLKVHFEQYFKGRPQSFISLVICIYILVIHHLVVKLLTVIYLVSVFCSLSPALYLPFFLFLFYCSPQWKNVGARGFLPDCGAGRNVS